MELIAPARMLVILRGQQFGHLGTHGGMLALIGADLALEHLHRTRFAVQGFIVPPFQGRGAQDDPFTADRMLPLFRRQFVKASLQLAAGRRRHQKMSDHAEAKMRPALRGPNACRFFFHTMPFFCFFSPLGWCTGSSTPPWAPGHRAFYAGKRAPSAGAIQRDRWGRQGRQESQQLQQAIPSFQFEGLAER